MPISYVRLDSLKNEKAIEMTPKAHFIQAKGAECQRCGRQFFGAAAQLNKANHFFCFTKREQAFHMRVAKLRFLKENSPDKLSFCWRLYLKYIDCCTPARKSRRVGLNVYTETGSKIG